MQSSFIATIHFNSYRQALFYADTNIISSFYIIQTGACLLKSVFEGNVNYLQIMDENGKVDLTLLPKGPYRRTAPGNVQVDVLRKGA